MDNQVPSVSAPVEHEREFCVKNIPLEFTDWDLFHVFVKYGVVHNVKIPSKQPQANAKFGFVVMETLKDADEVRCDLKNGKFLNTKNGVQLVLSNVRHGESQRSRDEGRSFANQGARLPLSEMSARNNGTKYYGRENSAGDKGQIISSARCFSQDLPLQTPIKVRVVDSPYQIKTVNEGFSFHVVPLEQKLSEDYSILQREMNKFCMKSPNLQDIPKVGQYVLYCRGGVAFRGLCNGDTTLYLIDIGEIVKINRPQLWDLPAQFARLPSLALEKWSMACSGGLTAVAHEYNGLINVVQLTASTEAGEDDFALSISRKGWCVCTSPTLRTYSRDDLLNAKKTAVCKPIELNENVAEIVTGLQNIAVA
ncbi:unnamed protein product [Nippostrongylus brasiliensis]|uniref:Maternal effect lethal protein 47 (inferred by orthology to a C. elegans protein) n=1 Tax=Nippostrongylus brasiliensis TaxID=27835 RepID=A0A0N4XX29_NIPBR|nr:unnamed protein product [Nippostrongylus brasiliensis]